MDTSVAASSMRYRAFISYSHADKAWADWLHKALETWRVPTRLVGQSTSAGVIPRRLIPVFRDRDELASATDLGHTVNAALAQSANLIVICSPHAAASRWVNEEVLAFKRHGRSGRIFCLIVAGEPDATDLPGRENEECFAPALRFTLGANGAPSAERTEPIAADARPGKDGKSNAKLKLIAGILDVGFDALKQREQHRKMQRMVALTALALMIMLLTTTLAIMAVFARGDAERRQKQAEDLVGFMLGDLTTKLRQVDRLDILSSVDDKAMAYFKALPLHDVNAASLAQRAKTLQKIGDVRMNQSRLSDSMEAFQQALRIDRRLVELSANDPARQNAYGEILLWVGFNYWQQGELDRTETAFKQAAAALEQAVRLVPADNEVQHNLDNVYNNLGHVAQARGELDAALADYVKDLALDERMALAHPADVLWQNALADAYSNLGAIALARGQLVDALTNDLKCQQQVANVVAGDLSNRQMQDQLLLDDAILARTLALAGHPQEGLNYANAALRIGEGLIAFDPSHTDWQDNYAYHGQLLLGQLLFEQGDIEGAVAPTDLALANETKLAVKDPDNAEWRSHLAEAQLLGARLALARKQPEEARQLAAQAGETVKPLLGAHAPNATAIRIQTGIEMLLGRLAADSGDADSATRYRTQAVVLMRPLATGSADPRNLSVWADALLAAGDKVQAMPVVEMLRRMGYRAPGFILRLRDQNIDYPQEADVATRIAQSLKSVAVAAAIPVASNTAGRAAPQKPRRKP